ncbi:MAG TPA: hypothetical protein DEP01_06395 [Aminobacterium sp.]|jgi:hypothetical protein|nr:hypothetical protein [Aminobacterium sp.]
MNNTSLVLYKKRDLFLFGKKPLSSNSVKDSDRSKEKGLRFFAPQPLKNQAIPAAALTAPPPELIDRIKISEMFHCFFHGDTIAISLVFCQGP